MIITVNHKSHEVETSTTLEQLVQQLEIQTRGIAVAINDQIMPKSEWNNTLLNEKDKVLIITATQGG